MEKMIRTIDSINKVFAYLSGILMILSVLLIIIEIIVRSVFNSTIYITTEYTAYFMVAISFFGLAYTLKDKSHIRMVFLQNVLKGEKGRLILDLYAYIIGLVVFVVITIVTFQFFLDSLLTQSQSMQLTKTYLAIPQSVLPLGSVLMALQFAAEIARTISFYRKGEFQVKETESQSLGH